jgi:pilus assembly protein FimV
VALDRSKVLEAAQKHLAKGNFDKAIAEYQRLVKEDPADVRTWLKIGDLFTRKGARREACQTYLRVAQHYADQGFFLKAVAVYKQILKLDATRLDISVKLADAYQQLDMTSEAVAAYEHVASSLARGGQVDKALAVLRKMVDLDPGNIPARIKLAEGLSKAGKAPQAAAEFDAGAQLLEQQGRFDDYIKVAERLLFHRPGDVKTARKLSALYLERNDAKRALAKLQLCFKSDPRDVETLELLARAFHVLGQTPKTISVYRETARILGDQGKQDERARILKRILELDPQDQDARQALAAYAERSSARLAQVDPPASALVESGARSAPTLDDDDIEELDVDEDDIMVVDDDDAEVMVVEERMSSMPAPEPRVSERPAPRISEASAARISAEAGMRTSIPPDVAREAQIARLLTECDVFLRYGLKNKVIGQLSQVLELDPSHVEAREKLKDLYVEMGHTDQAIAQLHALADVFEMDQPEVAQVYLQQILELRPDDALAHQRLGAGGGAAEEDDPFGAADGEDDYLATSLAPPPDDDTLALLDEPDSPDDFDAALAAEDEPEIEYGEPEVVEVEAGRQPRWAMHSPEVAEPEVAEPAEDAAAQFLDDDEDDLAPMSPEEFDAAPVSGAVPQVSAEGEEGGGGEVEEILDEAEFFLAQGMYSEARSSLSDALDEFPNHPLLVDKLREIDEAEGAGALDVEDEGDQSFELAERLAEELGDAGEGDTEQIDVETVFAQFKKGVAETVGADDIDTHFDLGIAYKEMGLIDDAVQEFLLCTTVPERECMAHTMIGLCNVERGNLADAIVHFKKGLAAAHKSEREELGLYFEIGHAHELKGEASEAILCYEKVKKRDPNFRGVDERIRALSKPRAHVAEQPMGGTMDDVDRAFDDLLRDD